jgi:uncharacterized RDD family membrane protein YckC
VSDRPFAPPAAFWKRVLALILDGLTSLCLFGTPIAWLTGNLTSNGFRLSGGPALLLLVLMVGYFYSSRRELGGTLWDHILGIGRPQPY